MVLLQHLLPVFAVNKSAQRTKCCYFVQLKKSPTWTMWMWLLLKYLSWNANGKYIKLQKILQLCMCTVAVAICTLWLSGCVYVYMHMNTEINVFVSCWADITFFQKLKVTKNKCRTVKWNWTIHVLHSNQIKSFLAIYEKETWIWIGWREQRWLFFS